MRASVVRSACSRCSPFTRKIIAPGQQLRPASRLRSNLLLQHSTITSVIHNEQQTASPIESHPSARTLEQERAALLEYERMQQTTKRLLSSVEPLAPAACQEFRVAFRYWAGHRARSFSDKSNGMGYAEALLEWLLKHADPQSIQVVIASEDSPNGGLVNLVESFLVPFRATNRSLQWREMQLRRQIDISFLRESLAKAAQVVKTMQALHENSSYPKLIPDRFSCNLLLNLWSKRCWFLNHIGECLEDDFISNSLDGVSTVTGCLQAMGDLVQEMEKNDAYPLPDHLSYTLLITAWAHSGLPEAASEAEALLLAMEDSPTAVLNEVPYNAVLFAHAMGASRDRRHATLAASLLNRMKDSQVSPVGVKPDVSSFASVMLAFSNAGQPDQAQQILELMELESESSHLQPNTVCYNTVLDAWGKSRRPEAATNAEALLNRMQDLYQSGSNLEACPDLVSYSSVILAWTRSKHANAVERAESILFALEEKSLVEGNHHLCPDLITYNTVLDAWSKHTVKRDKSLPSEHPHVSDYAVRRAEALLRHMQKLKPRLENIGVKHTEVSSFGGVGPDSVSYNSVLDAWSKSGLKNSVHRSRQLLNEMRRGYEAGNDRIKPNRQTYNIVLGCIAKSREPGSVLEAEKLLAEMEDQSDVTVKPDVVSYNTVMDALVKSGGISAAERAAELLEKLEEKYADGHESMRPNEITYNIVLNGFAKNNSGGSARRAEEVLERMTSLSEKQGRQDLRPSHVTFTTVLNAYSKCEEPDAVDKAEALFRRMESLQHVGATRVSFNTMINVFSRSGLVDAAQKAESLLDQMQQLYSEGNEEVKPDTVTFSSVINCWAQSGQKGAPERAEAILERMEELSHEKDSLIQPNAVSYSAVINAWAKSGSPQAAERAMRLLDRMERDYWNGDTNTRPNFYCYNATINAIAKSQDGEKADKAFAMLRRMAKAYEKGNDKAKPSHISYSTALNACAYTNGSRDQRARAFHVARCIFLEMMESDDCKPNSPAYYHFLLACENLLPPGRERDQIMAGVFRDSCFTGHTSKGIVRVVMRASVSPDILEEVLPEGDRRIPKEWTRNAERRTRRGKNQMN